MNFRKIIDRVGGVRLSLRPRIGRRDRSEGSVVPVVLQETTSFFERTIKPGNTVVVVGPSISMYQDPTLLLSAHLLREGGELLIADPIGEDNIDPSPTARRQTGSGVGGVKNYLSEIGLLKAAGMRLLTPVWLGLESTADSMAMVLDNSVDVVVDHGVAVFIAGQWGIDKKKLTAILNEYHRILKPGGKILFQANNEQYGIKQSSSLERVFAELGFRASYTRIQDVIEIPIEEEFYRKIMAPDAAGTDLYLGGRVVEREGRYYLKFSPGDHVSPDMYEVEKR